MRLSKETLYRMLILGQGVYELKGSSERGMLCCFLLNLVQ